jgi:hypothetical protein
MSESHVRVAKREIERWRCCRRDEDDCAPKTGFYKGIDGWLLGFANVLAC